MSVFSPRTAEAAEATDTICGFVYFILIHLLSLWIFLRKEIGTVLKSTGHPSRRLPLHGRTGLLIAFVPSGGSAMRHLGRAIVEGYVRLHALNQGKGWRKRKQFGLDVFHWYHLLSLWTVLS